MAVNYDTGSKQKAEHRLAAQDLTNSKYFEAIVAGPESLDRRLEAQNDFRFFCETYGKEVFGLEWSPAHIALMEKMEFAARESASLACACPRGTGKSSLASFCALWSTLCGHSRYALYIAATAGAAQQRLLNLKSSLRFNELLYKDFPEIIGPLRWCEGEARKSAGQKWHGEATMMQWNAQKVIYPTLLGFEDHADWFKQVNSAFGSVIDIASMESSIRGKSVESMKGEVIRPDIVICDDPSTAESARSPQQNKKRYDIITSDIGYLGSPSKPCGVIIPCTVVVEDDLASMLLDHEKSPQFRGEIHSALSQLPWEKADTPEDEAEIIELWENQYSEIRRFDLLDGTNHANDFYVKNREVMDGKSKALWEVRYNKDEISAIQHCMNLYLKSESAFFAEYQNIPKPQEASLKPKLTEDDILTRQIDIKRNVVPADADMLTCFVDISMRCLWWTVVAFNKETYKAHIVNGGVWPSQGKPYVTLSGVKKTIQDRYPELEYSDALFTSLGDFTDEMLATEFVNENGQPVHIDAIGIDCGWGSETNTVHKFTRRHAQSHRLYSCKGWGSTPLKRPLVDPEKPPKPGLPASLEGQWKALPNQYGASLIISDTNRWKTITDNALRAPLNSRSSLSIFGGRERGRLPNIRMFAEQLTAETGVLVESDGRSLEMWKNNMNRDEHLFDCVVGCYILANIKGAKLQSDRYSKAYKSKKRRKRYVKE